MKEDNQEEGQSGENKIKQNPSHSEVAVGSVLVWIFTISPYTCVHTGTPILGHVTEFLAALEPIILILRVDQPVLL